LVLRSFPGDIRSLSPLRVQSQTEKRGELEEGEEADDDDDDDDDDGLVAFDVETVRERFRDGKETTET